MRLPENPTPSNKTIRHATQARKPNLGFKKNFVTTSSLTSGLTHQITISLIIMIKDLKEFEQKFGFIEKFYNKENPDDFLVRK